MNAYEELASFILPREIFDSFEVIGTTSEVVDGEKIMHIRLDERNMAPDSSVPLSPNGFYAESRITDFPIRDHKVILHVRRRRWKDAEGNSYSNDWQLVAEGTRISNEFAAFLKGLYR